ncbi:ribulose-phosphate 3-epimerase [Desulfitobacterium hafniense]|uniref:Ribulose-phosphate 3-epimerase n=1 Tax=Desulfitobacterium hafniense (strain Y51) TaxID=138119 RepID=Q24T41_DESHY|nr:ribulose-phosphate 3-epimerase [Desulfitobacterium hafniense]BAE84801.1 hypothetical protein DSY3012 [Desulfitobacterium hafniense Y51]
MKDVLFSASMMCANYGHLETEIRSLETAGIDSFHVDIMDGHFVHNFAMGLYELKYICRTAKKNVECHLMITDPYNYIDTFADAGVDVVYIHPESEYQPSATIEKIQNAGMIPGIAINPGTSVETITELLKIVGRVLVMCVNPGNAGQIYLPFVHDKICKLLDMQKEYGFEVYWDGHGSVENIRKYAPLGVRGFVLGSATLFGKGRGYGEILSELRNGL